MLPTRTERRLEAMSVTDSPSISFPSELRPPLTDEEAVLEAERCLVCSGPYAVAPCTLACPAGVDVPGFIDALAREDDFAAAQTIFAENIIG